MIKKIIPVILCFFIICGCSADSLDSQKKVKIVTSIFPIYDFVRAVGKDRIDIKLLILPGTEVHSFDPKPSDISSLYDCDCFFYIGGESDKWVDRLEVNDKSRNIALIDYVNVLNEDGEKEADEHIWTSPKNAVIMISKICDILCLKDVKSSNYYKHNADSYIKEINKAAQETKRIISGKKNKYIIVADRFPFKYMADYYDLKYSAAFSGCAISTDISIKTMLKLVADVKRQKCDYVFCTEMSNRNIANALSSETGVKIAELHSAHNVTLDDFKKNITYVDIMKNNADALNKGMI